MSGLANGFCWAVWPQTIDFALSFIASSLGYLRARLGLPLHVSQASGFTPSPTAAKRETELAGLLDHKCLCRRMACASWFPGRQSAAGWWRWRWGSSVIILVQNVHAQLDPCFFPPKHVWLFPSSCNSPSQRPSLFWHYLCLLLGIHFRSTAAELISC